MSTAVDETRSLAARLSRLVDGEVIAADHASYEEARTVFVGGVDARPEAIVRPDSSEDVATAVTFARELEVPLAIRSGGHSAAGHGTVDDGVLIDLSSLKDFDLDVAGHTAWAGAGLTAGEYTALAAERGLATGFGDSGGVGIGGITLGGGIGYLSRKHGLTIDDLVAAEIVTASGEILLVDESSHPDLFWAIRGGGGNFGVVTRFQYRVHDVSEVVGGMLVLPAEPEILTRVMAAAQAAPDELTLITAVMAAPPLPFLPPEVHGKLVTMVQVCFAGDVQVGEKVVAPLRAAGTPLVDTIKPMPYAGLYPPEQGPPVRPTVALDTMYLDHVGEEEARTIIEGLQSSDARMRVVQLRPLGGAVSRVPTGTTAYAHRSSRIMANVGASYESAEERPGREEWVAQLAKALHQGDDGAYVNFLGPDGDIERAYPGATGARLRAVKAIYDPANLFRVNHNIVPEQG